MSKKAKKSALGQGLDSIFGQDVTKLIDDIESSNEHSSTQIDIAVIRPNPYQPRKTFDEKALNELCQSIQEHGIFTPLLLRKSLQGYEIIAGERRYRAALKAGLTEVPAIVVDFNDQQMMEVAILENVQREDLNPIEEANAYKNLMDKLGYTQEVLAQRVGKSREYCANMMRLLKLPSDVQELVSEGKLTMGHVRPLITLENEEEISELANKIIKDKMSVREVESYLKEMKNDSAPKRKIERVQDPYIKDVENNMMERLQTKVEIANKKIVIKYTNNEDLNRILELLNCIEE